ncbi:CLUMA_CG008096, isoform A [Clunio marinus]|uniref:CLUMA_CG008096, isoform A n=1 Tax=Clunio marinus TaxID=568069 RepID=A0A1J1I4S4_9DIPT|nr:CLUMA_CG008096, isoform A [Clunio marinus]
MNKDVELQAVAESLISDCQLMFIELGFKYPSLSSLCSGISSVGSLQDNFGDSSDFPSNILEIYVVKVEEKHHLAELGFD